HAASQVSPSSGSVAVVTNKSTALFQHRGTRLSRKEGLAMGALAPPSAYGGWLFLPGAARLHALELGTGTLQELCTSGPFRAALGPGQSPGSARLASARTAGGNGTDEYLALDVRELVGLASKKLVPGTATMHSGSTFHHSLRTEKPGYVVDLGSHWFVLSPQALRTTAEPCHAALIPLGRLAPLVGDVTARERTVFGLSSKGEWLAVNNEGAFRAVLAPGQTPPTGAKFGAASMARAVLYLGNWAVDTEDGRVLWCLPELDARSPAIPLAGGRVAFVSGTSELLCYRGSVEEAPLGEERKLASKASAPGSGSGVVLSDGRRLAGALTLEGERVRVASEPPREFELSAVALLENEGETRLLGEEHAVLLAWWDHLRARQLDGLARAFEGYRNGGHLAECQRLLEEAPRFEAEAELEEWSRSLVGKAQTRAANAEAQRARLRKEEEAERERVARAFHAAADWCAAHELAPTATVLLSRSELVAPLPETEAKARAFLPAAFPWHEASDAGRRWMRFAEELLPAGGAFAVAPRSVDGGLWKDALYLRTRNLALLSREADPVVLGECLRNGEGVLRLLGTIFGVPEGTGERLAVRLFEERAAYLAETESLGISAEWTGGIYSPGERVSRFFVTRDEGGTSSARRLAEVLVHELTHQFLSERWPPGKSAPRATTSGYWMIEGVAEFCSGQVVDLGRRRRSIDDRRALSIDASAGLLAQQALFPLRTFLALRQVDFAELANEPLGSVQLKHTLGRLEVTPKTLFYQQAASLFFFLFHDEDGAHRAELLELLASVHANGDVREPWTKLGYASLEELERRYHEFLAASVR
ncbi:MAG: hypothetical protein ABL998_19090, partial [Planctomycetota bacterium]